MAQSHKPTYSNPTEPEDLSPFMQILLKIWMRFGRFTWDLGGLALLALSVITLLGLSFPNLAGGIFNDWWINLIRRWLGWGSYFIVIIGGAVGLAMLRRRLRDPAPIRWGRVFALEASAFAMLVIFTLVNGNRLDRAELGLDGGVVGWGLAELFGMLLSPFWLGILMVIIVFWGLIAGLALQGYIQKFMDRLAGEPMPESGSWEADPGISVAPAEKTPLVKTPKPARKKPPRLAPEYRKQFRIEEKDERPTETLPRDERLPPFKLLVDERAAKPTERHINQRAGLIEQTLAEFGIPAKVIDFQVGPTVTQFAVEPGFITKPGATPEEEERLRKVRVSQIAGLQRDLALALSAERLRIQAPVPGRPYVGIEVPNSDSAIVRLRPILETESFQKINSPLAVALGRDVSGHPVVTDLATMPHLLIAGTTGSGKSVNIAALTTCLVMNNTPEELRLVMIDPKMVELVRFNGLPHLYGKVETDLERIIGVLRWVVVEMDRRYKLLEESRSRNIDTYNKKAQRRPDGEVLPRMVVMIDELADLMMSAPDQTEHNLVRLAQMARATGIHLVVATQRPSTDVVTGLIKANFPARMSFAVASSVDSRVILDTPGAESLLGKGDMLFLPPEAGSPVRVQGVMISDSEVDRVINYWHSTTEPIEEPDLLAEEEEEDEKPPWDEMLEQEAVLADRDGLTDKAIKLVRDTQRASASMLQRRLRVGYPRAARLIDELEELGIIGPSTGGGREREIFIDPDDDLDDYNGSSGYDDYD